MVKNAKYPYKNGEKRYWLIYIITIEFLLRDS
jgi:hypothetical protein